MSPIIETSDEILKDTTIKMRFVVPAIFSISILASTALIMATAIRQEAYASDFVWRTPSYNSNNNWSNPLNTCVGSPFSGDYECGYSDSSGIAKLYVRNWELNPKWVQARHNVDPPVANPDMHITQYRNLYFSSLLHGEYYMDVSQVNTGAEMRYGGWTALLRPADGQWVRDYYFYVYNQRLCAGNCGTDTYTVDSTNVSFVKGYFAGHYSVGSLFDAYAFGYLDEPLQTRAIVDAQNSGRAMYSDQLSIQWCDGGVC